MSPGSAASSRRARTRSTLAVNAGGTRLGSPFSNRRSRPLWRKPRIMRECVTYHWAVYNRSNERSVCPATVAAPRTCEAAGSQQCGTHGRQRRGRELPQPYHGASPWPWSHCGEHRIRCQDRAKPRPPQEATISEEVARQHIPIWSCWEVCENGRNGLEASNLLTRWSILVLLQAVSLAAQVPGGHPKILGGEEVKQGEFPFVVRVFCTGSIIAPNWVLSAAHCFIDRSGRIADPSLYSVTLGRHRDHPVATRNVRRIVVHPDYDYTGNSGVKRDLALLQVFRPFPVSPVKLLKPDEEPPSGSPSTSVGWGRTSDGTYPDVLMRVDHTFLTPEECNRTTPWGANTSSSQPPGFWVDEGVLCIGNEHIALWDSSRHDTEHLRVRGGLPRAIAVALC